MIDQGLYRAILADPPWEYDNWTAAKNGAAASAMELMATADIAAIPVSDWAHPDGAFLFLWGTWPKLPDSIEVMNAWGWDFVSGFPWVKTAVTTGNLALGTGFWTRGASEFLLIGRRGSATRRGGNKAGPPGLLCGSEMQFWAPRGGRHSQKPLEVMAWIERICKGPRLELFARRCQPGWTCYGLDTGWELGPWGARELEGEVAERQAAPKQDERAQRLLFAGRAE